LAVVDLLRWSLAAVLAAAAAAKFLAGARGRAALRSYGIERAPVRATLWAAAIVVEAALATAVLMRVSGAAEAAAAMLALFAAALVGAIKRGRRGRPCACFGGGGRIGWPAVARTSALAAGLAVLPVLPSVRPSTDAWLVAGIAVSLCAVAALGIAVLALAREVGQLRLALGPQLALSLEHEGPELGSRTTLIERFEGAAPLSLAVFSSPGCPLCHALEPSIRLVASDPAVELELFDEERDAEAWHALDVPGSPYAVVLARDGEVLAKGTFNTLLQLEGLLAGAAERVAESAAA
jgi:hypothetical protein